MKNSKEEAGKQHEKGTSNKQSSAKGSDNTSERGKESDGNSKKSKGQSKEGPRK